MKIFIINLDKDYDRFVSMKTQLENRGIKDYERVSAVFGKNILHEYDTKLSGPQLGCYLSHLRVYNLIVDRGLKSAIILEDDSIITDWYDSLDKIMGNTDYDFCWIGNSRAKWPRNTCNIIPDYNYPLIEKYKINQFLYSVSDEMIKTNNCPMGTYGLLVSLKGAKKVVSDTHKYLDPIDKYLVEKKDLNKCMTIPSIIIHCYDFGSNISNKEESVMENPFENIWKKYPEKEEQVLEFLQHLNYMFNKHNVRYSVINSIMIGYARQGKLIPFDNSLEIAVDLSDKEKLGELFGDYYFNDRIYINKEKWPFFQVIYFRVPENIEGTSIENKGKFLIGKKSVKTLGNIIPTKIGSHNSDKMYNINIFENYKEILDTLHPDWSYKCISKTHDYINDKKPDKIYSFNCDNVLVEYSGGGKRNIEKLETHYSKKDTNRIFTITRVMVALYIILIGVIIYMRK